MKENMTATPVWRNLLYCHLPFVAYAAAVIYVSSQPNLKAPELRFIAFDKVAHFFEYAFFAFLAFRSISSISVKQRPNRSVLVAALILLVFAVLDEYFQRFVPGRYFDPADLVTDFVGGSLVLLLLWLRRRRKDILAQ